MSLALLLAPDPPGEPPCEPLPVSEDEEHPHTLYITLGRDGEFKAGTCPHCVLEPGRPARAWEARGDQDLDFARDALFAALGELGIIIVERYAYVCP